MVDTSCDLTPTYGAPAALILLLIASLPQVRLASASEVRRLNSIGHNLQLSDVSAGRRYRLHLYMSLRRPKIVLDVAILIAASAIVEHTL